MVQNNATVSYIYSDPYSTDQSGTSALDTSASDAFSSDISISASDSPGASGSSATPQAALYLTQTATPTVSSTPSNTLYEALNGNIPAISPMDIDQGDLGDCYLLATISALAVESPTTIENMITSDGNGIYTVNFLDRYTSPITVNINTVFSVSDRATAPVVNGVNETWPLILEAAYAEYEGNDFTGTNLATDLANIASGWMDTSMYVLLGVDGNDVYAEFDKTTTAAQLMALSAAGDLITFGVISTTSTNPYGLIGDHAYSLDGLTTVGGQTYAELLNPWGPDYESSEPALIPIADLLIDSTTGAASGIYAMDYCTLAAGGVATPEPTVSAIQLQASSATLSAGQAVTIDMTWSDAITLAPGTVSLALSNGGTAAYVSGSGTDTLQFSYTATGSTALSSLSVYGINESGAYGVNFYDLTDTTSGQQASTYFTGLTQADVIPNTLSLSGTNNTENVSGYTITMAADTTAAINGENNSVSVGNGSSLNLTGSSNTVNTGSSDTLTDNSGGNTITIFGSGDTITASSDTVDVTLNTGQLSNSGIGSGDTLTVTGTNDTVSATGGIITLNTGDSGINITGSNNTVNGSSGNSFTVSGVANDVINGSGMAITLSATSGNFISAGGTPETQLSLLSGDLYGTGQVNYSDVQLLNADYGQPGYTFGEYQEISQYFGDTGQSLVQLMGGSAGTNITGNSDTVAAASGDDMTITGTNDTVNGSNAVIGLYSGDTGTTVTGSNDTVFGTSGDTMTVTGNSDFINAGFSSSVTVAGNNDTLAFSATPGANTVTGFNTSDALQFSQTLFANFAAAMSDATQVGANTVFTGDGGASVTLLNVAKNTLTASNFHFAA